MHFIIEEMFPDHDGSGDLIVQGFVEGNIDKKETIILNIDNLREKSKNIL